MVRSSGFLCTLVYHFSLAWNPQRGIRNSLWNSQGFDLQLPSRELTSHLPPNGKAGKNHPLSMGAFFEVSVHVIVPSKVPTVNYNNSPKSTLKCSISKIKPHLTCIAWQESITTGSCSWNSRIIHLPTLGNSISISIFSLLSTWCPLFFRFVVIMILIVHHLLLSFWCSVLLWLLSSESLLPVLSELSLSLSLSVSLSVSLSSQWFMSTIILMIIMLLAFIVS